MNRRKRHVVIGAALALLLVVGTASLLSTGRDSVKADIMDQSGPRRTAEGSRASPLLNVQGDTDPETCDTGLALDSANPVDAVRAIDICKLSSGPTDWGLVSAEWVMADGTAAVSDPNYALGHGLLSGFGPNVTVRQGDRLFALSSGTARQPTDPGFIPVADYYGFDKGYTCNHPDGFPVAVHSCMGACPTPGEPHDVAALEVKLRAPANAYAFAFDWKFYASDYPAYVCTEYNDYFVAILDPMPVGLPNGNIVYDANGAPASINADFPWACTPDSSAGCYTCPQGTHDLLGTGFEGHAATVWQTVTSDIEPGSLISLRFAVYDSGDGSYDSTALIDNFRWLREWYPVWLPLLSR